MIKGFMKEQCKEIRVVSMELDMISLRARRVSKQTLLPTSFPLEIGIRVHRGNLPSNLRSSVYIILKICPKVCNCCLGVEIDLAECCVCK